jgi:hypothetical protein
MIELVVRSKEEERKLFSVQQKHNLADVRSIQIQTLTALHRLTKPFSFVESLSIEVVRLQLTNSLATLL